MRICPGGDLSHDVAQKLWSDVAPTRRDFFGERQHLIEGFLVGDKIARKQFLACAGDLPLRHPEIGGDGGVAPIGKSVLVANGDKEEVEQDRVALKARRVLWQEPPIDPRPPGRRRTPTAPGDEDTLVYLLHVSAFLSFSRAATPLATKVAARQLEAEGTGTFAKQTFRRNLPGLYHVLRLARPLFAFFIESDRNFLGHDCDGVLGGSRTLMR